ncbi:MAG: response regulator [Salinivirgaceae bacterium]|nr:response regulator [Salinivirgaceae bacterium]
MDSNSIKIDNLVNQLKDTAPEAAAQIEQYAQTADNRIKELESEIAKLREQMNVNQQRHELFIESLDIENSTVSYTDFFVRFLERIGYHMNPKRLFIFLDDDANVKSNLTCQWTSGSAKRLPPNCAIEHLKCPSWSKTLNEKRMIRAEKDSELPDDISLIVKQFGFENAYVFPLMASGKICGSLIYETCADRIPDDLEISYINILSILLSGHISKHKTAEILKREKEHAQEADRLKSAFLVNMSHDIRIPLNSILGFSDLLADPDLTETERDEFISLIDKSGRDLISLVDNIIDISKIETGQMNIKLETCKLKALMNDIMATYNHHPKFEEHSDLSLQLDFAERFNQLSIKTDIFRFRQICINLIDNAIQFTDAGTIKFGVSNAWENTIEFYVQDTGIGIPEESMHVIFQNFCKINRTSTREYTGTGLGLPISKSLIEMLGGSIRVVSVPGKGSTFYFTHPLPEKVPESVNNLHEIKSLFNWEGRRIAIADDIEQDRKYMEYILNNTNAEIVWLNNDIEALDYFKKGNTADVLLMEMQLSSINGIEPAISISNLTETPIIALTANTNTNETRSIAEKAGCADVMSKPLNMSNLLNMINKVMKSPEENTDTDK